MFLPTTKEEVERLGWSCPDIILVSGDSYIDSPYIGIALIGKWLMAQGYKVAVIAQPEINSPEDITRLGEPGLFWGVSGGCIDSMVANWTASGKRRNRDDFTPGGENNRRPDRAVIAYSNLIRRYFKNTKPIVLGGIEASLRRLAHFDFKSGKIRRSLLLDAKADFLLYGMAEHSVLELANALNNGESVSEIKGLCYISDTQPENAIILPSYEECLKNEEKFLNFSMKFFSNTEPFNGELMVQLHGKRYIVHNPPAEYLTSKELDFVYELDFERELHPFYAKEGRVRALDTIRFSVTTHRGCFGNCSFCAIAVHQGRIIRSRSEASIIKEVKSFLTNKSFKGVISDIGGPTANMYMATCEMMDKGKVCSSKKCLFPQVCSNLKQGHGSQINLLKKIKQISGIKKVFVASGIRYDMILSDSGTGLSYLKYIMKNGLISGQMKIAPEHTEEKILHLMQKPKLETLTEFKTLFDSINSGLQKKLYLTYYLIAAHPGCTQGDMSEMKKILKDKLGHIPEQIQIFTPTPSTISTLMYYTELNPFSNLNCFVEKNPHKREVQKRIISDKKSPISHFRKKNYNTFKKK